MGFKKSEQVGDKMDTRQGPKAPGKGQVVDLLVA
jgi:hypothetical protein